MPGEARRGAPEMKDVHPTRERRERGGGGGSDPEISRKRKILCGGHFFSTKKDLPLSVRFCPGGSDFRAVEGVVREGGTWRYIPTRREDRASGILGADQGTGAMFEHRLAQIFFYIRIEHDIEHC